MKFLKIFFTSLLFSTAVFGQNQLSDTVATKNTLTSQRDQVSSGINSGVGAKVKTDTLSTLERKLFGYMVFHNPSVTFTPNLNMATPKNYVFGPGDVIQIQVYGVAQKTYSLPVNNEGNISIDDIGLVHLGGLTIEAAKSLLQKKLAIRYSGMNGANPNTFIDVTLENIRSIKINMVGEVYRPGTYVLPSYVNVFNALFAAGGPTLKGTFRYVQVYRSNRLVGEIDLYEFLAFGKSSGNLRLEDNDVVLIRPSTNRVVINGEVRIPGYFELKNNEKFQDLLKYTGGFTGQAYKTLVKVVRKGETENKVFDIPAAEFAKAILIDADSLTVDLIANKFSNRVQVSGSVIKPGAFELVKGMTVSDIIQKAGGLKGDAFAKKALLYRTNIDYTQEVITVDLSKNNRETIFLQNEDVLTISSIYDLKEEYYVQISGEVNSSGIYPFSDSLTVSGLIMKAGGFKYSASGSYIELMRRNNSDLEKLADIYKLEINKDLSISDKDGKLTLKPFDHIFVRNKPGYETPKLVSIIGEVTFKGSFAIDKKEMRISDLITRAGGLTKFAYPKGATLLRRTKYFKSPSTSTLENVELEKLLGELSEDPILASTESNIEYIKRIKQKIKLNNINIDKEKELNKKEELKNALQKENIANLSSSTTRIEEDKQMALVAFDLISILANPGSSEDLVLKDGDELNVPEKLEIVNVKGGVLYPSSVRYDPSLHFKEYINRAGGYDRKAIRKQAYLIQANGKVQRAKSYFLFRTFPKVEPGAEIVVPANLIEKAPINPTQTIGLLTGFITTLLTLIFLIRSI